MTYVAHELWCCAVPYKLFWHFALKALRILTLFHKMSCIHWEKLQGSTATTFSWSIKTSSLRLADWAKRGVNLLPSVKLLTTKITSSHCLTNTHKEMIMRVGKEGELTTTHKWWMVNKSSFSGNYALNTFWCHVYYLIAFSYPICLYSVLV